MNIFDSFIVTKYIAHRGYFTESLPENSLSAFENAIKNNYGIEFDVRVTSDDVPVIFHDKALKRTTGSDGYIEHMPYKEIKNIKLANGEKIPTLDEALKFVLGRTPIIVDVKNEGKVGETEKCIWKVLSKYEGEYAICSYNPYTLEWFKTVAPKVLRGQYSSFFKKQTLSFAKKGKLKKLKYNEISEPQFIVYNSENLPNKFVKKFEHLPVIAYTVKTQNDYIGVLPFSDNIIFEGFEPQS